MDERTMRTLFSEARVARLASINATGTPHLVPVCFALHNNEILSVVDAKPKTTTSLKRLENIARDERVALITDLYDDSDWNRLWWVRVEGRARVVETGVEYAQVVNRLRAKYPQYSARRPTGPAIIVTADRWTGWNAS